MIQWFNENQGFAVFILSAALVVLAVAAVSASVSVGRRQNRISLFERRLDVYNALNKIVLAFGYYRSDQKKDDLDRLESYLGYHLLHFYSVYGGISKLSVVSNAADIKHIMMIDIAKGFMADLARIDQLPFLFGWSRDDAQTFKRMYQELFNELNENYLDKSIEKTAAASDFQNACIELDKSRLELMAKSI